MTLIEAALAFAVSQLGVHEQGGNNTGPEVDVYLASVNLSPGNSWCAAFFFYCFKQAALRLGLVNPCPRTGGVLKLWTMAEPICRATNPAPGYGYILDHGHGLGHAGIVACVNDTDAPIDYAIPDTVATLLGLPAGTTSVSVPPGSIAEISGNTNAAGSREGNMVAIHVGTSPEAVHGGVLRGYLNFDLAAQAPSAS